MRPSRLVVLLLLLVVVAAGCSSEDREVDPTGAAYVALGDSYTAGPGMVPIADNSCRRSKINYPSLVDAALKVKSFSDRSCAGAQISDLEEPQAYKDPRTGLPVRVNEPQVNALGPNTSLVTIGIGLNDHAISTGLLLICTTPSLPEPNETCKKYLEQPQSAIDAQIRGAAAELKGALEDIQQKAPNARIVLVGYPRVVPDEGGCGRPGQAGELLPVPDAQVTRLRESMKVVNQAWSEVARQVGALYVDMYTASAGHDICSDDPWVSGYLGVPGKAAGLHPFPSYAKAVADAIVAILAKS